VLALLIRRPGGLVVEMPDGAPHGCSAVALTPGWMRSEMKLEHYQVTGPPPQRRFVLLERASRATTGSPTSAAPSRTAGATCAKSKTRGCLRTRPATAEPAVMI